jgi:hypothetical protein
MFGIQKRPNLLDKEERDILAYYTIVIVMNFRNTLAYYTMVKVSDFVKYISLFVNKIQVLG